MFILEGLYTFKPGNIKHLISVTASFYLEARVDLGLQSCFGQDFPSLHPHLVLLKTSRACKATVQAIINNYPIAPSGLYLSVR